MELPFIEHVSAGAGSYLLLARLDDYRRFVSDENGNLRRYLFDSNVRDFLRGTRVNEDIAESLRLPSAPDFWWLNNGVTILATNAALSGKTISLQNIQIVNGLQTTETIFRHFESNTGGRDDRTLLIKVLVSTDSLVRDRIIRATNNQNAVELASLHATDKIQRDIEDILEKNEWFYERRRNYYRNIGKPAHRFVTPLYLASCVLSLAFKNPASAARVKSRFMRNQSSYAAVFSEEFPLLLWPVIVDITKAVEQHLSSVRPGDDELGDRFLAKWRGLVSLVCVARLLGTFDYSTSDLLNAASEAITPDLFAEVWIPIREAAAESTVKRMFKSPYFIQQCCEAAAEKYHLEGVACVGRRQLPGTQGPLDAEFLDAVAKLLPSSRSHPHPQKVIAKQLGCSSALAKAALRVIAKRESRRR